MPHYKKLEEKLAHKKKPDNSYISLEPGFLPKNITQVAFYDLFYSYVMATEHIIDREKVGYLHISGLTLVCNWVGILKNINSNNAGHGHFL